MYPQDYSYHLCYMTLVGFGPGWAGRLINTHGQVTPGGWMICRCLYNFTGNPKADILRHSQVGNATRLSGAERQKIQQPETRKMPTFNSKRPPPDTSLLALGYFLAESLSLPSTFHRYRPSQAKPKQNAIHLPHPR